jgi:hypothetical protein
MFCLLAEILLTNFPEEMKGNFRRIRLLVELHLGGLIVTAVGGALAAVLHDLALATTHV